MVRRSARDQRPTELELELEERDPVGRPVVVQLVQATRHVCACGYRAALVSRLDLELRALLHWAAGTFGARLAQEELARRGRPAQFRSWEPIRMARWDGTGRRARRLFRRCIVPRRANTIAAYEAGRHAS